MTQKASVRMEEIRRRTRRLRQRRAHRINCALSAVCLFLTVGIASLLYQEHVPGLSIVLAGYGTAALMPISWSASAPLSPALYSRCSASGTGGTKYCTAPSPRMLQTRLPPKASLTTSSALHALLPHTFLHTPKRLCRFSRQSLFPFNQKQHAETERRAVLSGSMVICPTCRTGR
jgi:hypothetical protein